MEEVVMEHTTKRAAACIFTALTILAHTNGTSLAIGICTPTVGVSNWSTNTKPIRNTAINSVDTVCKNITTAENTTFRPLNGKKVEFLKVGNEN